MPLVFLNPLRLDVYVCICLPCLRVLLGSSLLETGSNISLYQDRYVFFGILLALDLTIGRSI